jgi:hypothetical protein
VRPHCMNVDVSARRRETTYDILNLDTDAVCNPGVEM